jgi:hypothetical protein
MSWPCLRFWVYALYDARTDEFSEIGKPYGTADHPRV